MRYVYILVSGTLHPTDQKYWYGIPRAFTTIAKARREMQNILRVNEAEEVEEQYKLDSLQEIENVTYYGEQRRYKASIIITKLELR